ncbi:hypothetical protein TSTA_008560 [Talaromyces stipitatus ATCC 10500]|uniref:Helicase C-terminal domain-containing protein n=1 Tax=Talaromyces stipitatus (strain ATCC 10500 / CBS 375.48 / QM 6759 / NRRL 1006) TaxID=441959 RepID=B8MVA4_TALSN|nr:uncharacterized protein TSTA_008560 [Talaromyces stipitatus ATCC 10500]EED11560.1 hypothetical protein TSTA_008560 [Talaromyces stipitatus ATCC 10500]
MKISKKDCAEEFASKEHNVCEADVRDHWDILKEVLRPIVEQSTTKTKCYVSKEYVDRYMRVTADNTTVKEIRDKLHYLTPQQWHQFFQSCLGGAVDRLRYGKKKGSRKRSRSQDSSSSKDGERTPHQGKKSRNQSRSRDTDTIDSIKTAFLTMVENSKDYIGIKIPLDAKIFCQLPDHPDKLASLSVYLLTASQQDPKFLNSRQLDYGRLKKQFLARYPTNDYWMEISYTSHQIKHVVFDSITLQSAVEKMIMSSDEFSLEAMTWTPTERPLLRFDIQLFSEDDNGMVTVERRFRTVSITPQNPPSPISKPTTKNDDLTRNKIHASIEGSPNEADRGRDSAPVLEDPPSTLSRSEPSTETDEGTTKPNNDGNVMDMTADNTSNTKNDSGDSQSDPADPKVNNKDTVGMPGDNAHPDEASVQSPSDIDDDSRSSESSKEDEDMAGMGEEDLDLNLEDYFSDNRPQETLADDDDDDDENTLRDFDSDVQPGAKSDGLGGSDSTQPKVNGGSDESNVSGRPRDTSQGERPPNRPSPKDINIDENGRESDVALQDEDEDKNNNLLPKGQDEEMAEDGFSDEEDYGEAEKQLVELNSNVILERVTENDINRLCRFLKLQRSDVANIDHRIPIPGLRYGGRPYQAFGAMWMLLQDTGTLRGGFLGDMVGLGKTFTVLMYFVLGLWIANNYADVKNAWKTGDPRHHPLGHTVDGPCPSEKGWPIECCCIKGSLSYQVYNPNKGATVVFAPLSLLDNWVKEFHYFVDPDAMPEDNRPISLAAHSRIKCKNSISVNGGKEPFTIPRLEDFIHKNPGDHQPLNVTAIQKQWKQWFDTKPKQGDQPDFDPPKHNRRMQNIFIITTDRCFKKHVDHKFRLQFFFGRRGYHCIPYGRFRSVHIDEAHKAKTSGCGTIGELKNLRKTAFPPNIWALSGTMLQNSPGDLAGYCGVFQVAARDWNSDDRLEGISEAQLLEDKKAFDSIAEKFSKDTSKELSEPLAKNKKFQDIKARVQRFLQASMIARSHTSLWPDEGTARRLNVTRRTLTEIKRIEPQVLWQRNHLSSEIQAAMEVSKATFEREVKDYINSTEKPVGEKKAIRQVLNKSGGLRTRLFATFPFLVLYDDDIALTQQEIYNKEEGRRQIMDVLPQYEDKCWKLGWIHKYVIETMRKETSYHNGPRKIIFIAQNVCVAHTIHRWLSQKFPEHRVLYIDGHTVGRSSLVEDFSEDNYTRGNEYDSPTMLVATARVFAEGFNVTRASHMVLLEGFFNEASVQQAIGRINRIGQKDPHLEVFQLRTEGDFVEERLDRRVEIRSNLVEASTADAA